MGRMIPRGARRPCAGGGFAGNDSCITLLVADPLKAARDSNVKPARIPI